ncbi:MAG: FliI/YscN family ATPase [Myxococcales bacterium]|nr:FliI/YscN family ATPase [Polyangiaceae bacterium]MDW8251839.1 FliI/YscN family ATPase [Myxococcales bacterium]
MDLEALRKTLRGVSTVQGVGQVRAVTGLALRALLPGARVGEVVVIRRVGEPLRGEIVGFVGEEVVVMPLGELTGVGPDDPVETTGHRLTVRASDGLLGRVLDGLGQPMDGGPLPEGVEVPVERAPPSPLARRPIARPLATGVRVLDAMLTLGEGQRVGLFAGSGVGKSTLLGAITRGTEAEVVVVALVGERGREVGEFLEHALGVEGRRKSVVVVATSDAPALERLRAPQVATALAEHFRDQGRRVLLLIDSITRYARAQREVGLAAGEPPARRGYPPSVFAVLPRLLERAGQSDRGSITAIYTVLVEGGDMEEPIADEVRGILDGHIVLDRAIAARGRYPAVDVPVSLSRVMDSIVSPQHRDAARKLRALLGAYEQKRDLIALGAYAKGSDPLVDQAIVRMSSIEALLSQRPEEQSTFEQATTALFTAVR